MLQYITIYCDVQYINIIGVFMLRHEPIMLPYKANISEF